VVVLLVVLVVLVVLVMVTVLQWQQAPARMCEDRAGRHEGVVMVVGVGAACAAPDCTHCGRPAVWPYIHHSCAVARGLTAGPGWAVASRSPYCEIAAFPAARLQVVPTTCGRLVGCFPWFGCTARGFSSSLVC
jgi:hypothetical protein